MSKTQNDNKKIVEEIFKNNPTIKVVYKNPKGEYFTQKSYAENSLLLDKEGKRVGQLKEYRR